MQEKDEGEKVKMVKRAENDAAEKDADSSIFDLINFF
jgi:hypothetical protein